MLRVGLSGTPPDPAPSPGEVRTSDYNVYSEYGNYNRTSPLPLSGHSATLVALPPGSRHAG